MAPGPQLRTAKQRTQRAAGLLALLESKVEAFRQRATSASLVVRVSREALDRGGPFSPTLDWSEVEPHRTSTVEISLLVSEIIHHLRAALDYVAYNLVWLDLGTPRERTQFPIAETEPQWRDAQKRRLRGLSTQHVEVILEYQPFRGCRWTRELRELSNADKHRFLVDIPLQLQGSFQIDPAKAEADPADPDMARLRFPMEGLVKLPDGADVVDTMKHLCREVALLLKRLQEDFHETDELQLREDRGGSDRRESH